MVFPSGSELSAPGSRTCNKRGILISYRHFRNVVYCAVPQSLVGTSAGAFGAFRVSPILCIALGHVLFSFLLAPSYAQRPAIPIRSIGEI